MPSINSTSGRNEINPQDYSENGKRLFDELERLLAQPNGLQQLFDEFGRRTVCDAILSEEEPSCSLNAAEIREMIDRFFATRPNMVDRKFEITLTLLSNEKANRASLESSAE